jgi:hypothetical protein
MKTFQIIAAAVTALLLVMVLICGLWIKAQGSNLDPSSLSFHMILGMATVGAGLVSAALVILGR